MSFGITRNQNAGKSRIMLHENRQQFYSLHKNNKHLRRHWKGC